MRDFIFLALGVWAVVGQGSPEKQSGVASDLPDSVDVHLPISLDLTKMDGEGDAGTKEGLQIQSAPDDSDSWSSFPQRDFYLAQGLLDTLSQLAHPISTTDTQPLADFLPGGQFMQAIQSSTTQHEDATDSAFSSDGASMLRTPDFFLLQPDPLVVEDFIEDFSRQAPDFASKPAWARLRGGSLDFDDFFGLRPPSAQSAISISIQYVSRNGQVSGSMSFGAPTPIFDDPYFPDPILLESEEEPIQAPVSPSANEALSHEEPRDVQVDQEQVQTSFLPTSNEPLSKEDTQTTPETQAATSLQNLGQQVIREHDKALLQESDSSANQGHEQHPSMNREHITVYGSIAVILVVIILATITYVRRKRSWQKRHQSFGRSTLQVLLAPPTTPHPSLIEASAAMPPPASPPPSTNYS